VKHAYQCLACNVWIKYGVHPVMRRCETCQVWTHEARCCGTETTKH